jgi:hypothetical protein
LPELFGSVAEVGDADAVRDGRLLQRLTQVGESKQRKSATREHRDIDVGREALFAARPRAEEEDHHGFAP